MTLLIALFLSAASAQECPSELTKAEAALEAAADSLESAASSLETYEIEVDELDAEIDQLDEDIEHAEELLALLREASLVAPDQPVGAWAAALSCYFDEEACPPEGEPMIPVLPEAVDKKALKKAAKKP